MLVIKVIDFWKVHVIHYTSRQILEHCVIITEPIECVIYKDDVPTCDVQEGIRRARLRKYETYYQLFSNNCESFVNWALTGKDVTDQGENARTVVEAAIEVGAIGFSLWALMRMFSSDDSKEKDKK